MNRMIRSQWFLVLILAVAGLFPTRVNAHPGTGIVIDRLGQVYFVDMVSGVWKVDTRGVLTHLPGPAFHWMTLDADDRFGAARLPSGSSGDVARIPTLRSLLLASDYPLAMGRDGNLYFPSHDGNALQVLRFTPTGQTSSLASLPGTTAGPLRHLNGLAAGPDGSLYYTENNAIRRISMQGKVSTIVPSIARANCSAHEQPLLRGLAINAGGTLLVAASGCGSVLEISPAGQVTVRFQVAAPWTPTGVAVFGNDVYVLEFLHAESDDRRAMLPRVRKITADGKSTIIANVTRH
jgi:hypothetical protein